MAEDIQNDLVNIAYKMGQALVPSDTSKLMQAQFQALGKTYESQMEGVKTGVKVGSEIWQKSIDEKNAEKAEWKDDAAYYGSADDKAKNTIIENKESAAQEVRRRKAERELRKMNKEETIEGLGITGEINYTPSEVKSLNKY